MEKHDRSNCPTLDILGFAATGNCQPCHRQGEPGSDKKEQENARNKYSTEGKHRKRNKPPFCPENACKPPQVRLFNLITPSI
jgi:hypothetical protein